MPRLLYLLCSLFFWNALAADRAPAAEDMQRDLTRASDLLAAGKEDEAMLAYTDYLRRYPDSESAVEAQFSIGEIYYRARKFSEASIEYKKVFGYGVDKNTRAADASLRLGECWQKMGEPDLARIEWEAIKRKFPKSEMSHQAEVLIQGLAPAPSSTPTPAGAQTASAKGQGT